MRKLFFTLTCMAFTCLLHAQILYSTTSGGGKNGGGTIAKLVTGTNQLTPVFDFDTPDGKSPMYTNLLEVSNGKMYGMTEYGGKDGNGVLFSYDPAIAVYTTLHFFSDSTGSQPTGSLIQAKDGKLYGMTSAGGNHGSGVIFSFNQNTLLYTKLIDFDSTNGAAPNGSLMQASDGLLYGLTAGGGNNANGVIFSFNPITNELKRLKDFNGTDGAHPKGSLMQAKNGKLYGMTLLGGAADVGVIFSFDPVKTVYQKLQDLNYTDGCKPYGDLIQAKDGKLYGLMENGGSFNSGVVFSFTTTGTYTKLKDLEYNGGCYPFGKLLQATDGKLYGMTVYGGANGDGGTIFSINPSTSEYIVVKSFNWLEGKYPYSSLIQHSNGKLYGLTSNGGNGSVGALFSFDITSQVYTKLRDLGINNYGDNIQSGLTKDSTGLLYGITSNGGVNGCGVIYSYNPVTAVFSKLKDMDYLNGAYAQGSLMQAKDGKLYGMTYGGGSYNLGVIFSYNPATSVYTKLMDFKDTLGTAPMGNLIQSTNGKLYGMAMVGGNENGGVIFCYDPATNVYTKLKDLEQATGSYPHASLMLATDGRLYGMTGSGGLYSYGTIFSFDINTSVYTNLKNFDMVTGAYPYSSLMQAKDGKLYGITEFGGTYSSGILFSVNISTNGFTKLKDFDGNNGAKPGEKLMQASDGKLYGTTTVGGINNLGVAYSFDPVTSTYAKLQDFNGMNGKNPANTFFTEVAQALTIKINNVSMPEGNSGTTLMNFTVTLSSKPKQTVKVDYATKDGTAKAPTDYTAQTGTLTFAPGVKSQLISIAIKGDSQVEGDEKFKVILSKVVNATVKDSIGIGTILNDDAGLMSAATSQISNSAPLLFVTPNPAIDIIQVQLSGYKGNVLLQLLDMHGKVLQIYKMQANDMSNLQHQFNVSALANGTYIVMLTDEKGNKQVKNVIVNH